MKLTAEQFLHRLLRSSSWSSADKARLYGLAACGRASVAVGEVLRDNRIDRACFPLRIEREEGRGSDPPFDPHSQNKQKLSKP